MELGGGPVATQVLGKRAHRERGLFRPFLGDPVSHPKTDTQMICKLFGRHLWTDGALLVTSTNVLTDRGSGLGEVVDLKAPSVASPSQELP